MVQEDALAAGVSIVTFQLLLNEGLVLLLGSRLRSQGQAPPQNRR